MSHIRPELITAIAETSGIKGLHSEAASVLAPDVEYRVRDILQVLASTPVAIPLRSSVARAHQVAHNSWKAHARSSGLLGAKPV